MNKLVATGVAALTLLDIASAEAQNWSGPYVGVHAGHRWADSSFSAPAFALVDPFGPDAQVPARSESYNTDGGIVGMHAGYNIQLQGGLLIGFEGDLTYGRGKDIKSSRIIGADGVVTRTSTLKMGSQGTLRARLGVTTGPALFYATGGAAFADIDWTETMATTTGEFLAQPLSVGKSNIRTGWTVGGGGEWLLDQHYTFRMEYLYENFGSFTVPLAGTSKLGTLDTEAHKVRAGISFRF